jgi:hypothetical protein
LEWLAATATLGDKEQHMSDLSAQQIKVRQVTHWQPTFIASETPGGAGSYTFQLVLDHGAEEAVLVLDEDDADNLFDWLSASSVVHYDIERRVLLFGARATGS